MAQSALLEREYQASIDDEKNTPEAIAHRKRSSEIYSKVFETKEFNAADIAALVSAPSASAKTAVLEPETAPSPAAVSAAPATREPAHTSTGIAYKDHMLTKTDVKEETGTIAAPSAPSAPAAPVAPAREPARRYAPEIAPSYPDIEENEDLRPTPRTMETLRREEILQQEFDIDAQREQRVGFFASLSAKAKMALAIVTALFVVAIALVFINTGIINSIKDDLVTKQAELKGLTEYSEQLNGRIEEITDPAFVDDYAEHELGMTRS